MNAQMKKRLAVVSGVVVIVLIVVLAIIGGGTAAQTLTVAQAAENPKADQKVQVSGNVVENSFSTENNTLQFKIYDSEGDPTVQLQVFYDGAASSTFGNDVTAICTGRMDENGALQCSELVTKCPSKYESAESALTVDRLMGYDSDIVGKMVKVEGVIDEGSLKPAGQGERFVIFNGSSSEPAYLPVVFDGALSDEVTDDTRVVLTGSLGEDGKFAATDVAIKG